MQKKTKSASCSGCVCQRGYFCWKAWACVNDLFVCMFLGNRFAANVKGQDVYKCYVQQSAYSTVILQINLNIFDCYWVMETDSPTPPPPTPHPPTPTPPEREKQKHNTTTTVHTHTHKQNDELENVFSLILFHRSVFSIWCVISFILSGCHSFHSEVVERKQVLSW